MARIRDTLLIREAKSIGALSASAALRIAGIASSNASIVTSIGGIRVPTSSCHLLTRVARIRDTHLIREANSIGALSASAGLRIAGIASSNGSLITSIGGSGFPRPVATCSHAWLGLDAQFYGLSAL